MPVASLRPRPRASRRRMGSLSPRRSAPATSRSRARGVATASRSSAAPCRPSCCLCAPWPSSPWFRWATSRRLAGSPSRPSAPWEHSRACLQARRSCRACSSASSSPWRSSCCSVAPSAHGSARCPLSSASWACAMVTARADVTLRPARRRVPARRVARVAPRRAARQSTAVISCWVARFCPPPCSASRCSASSAPLVSPSPPSS